MARRAMPGAIRYLASRAVWIRREVRAIPCRRLAARFEVEFVENVRDVALDGVQAQVERTRDQFVAVARGDARQHFDFARRQALGSCSD